MYMLYFVGRKWAQAHLRRSRTRVSVGACWQAKPLCHGAPSLASKLPQKAKTTTKVNSLDRRSGANYAPRARPQSTHFFPAELPLLKKEILSFVGACLQANRPCPIWPHHAQPCSHRWGMRTVFHRSPAARNQPQSSRRQRRSYSKTSTASALPCSALCRSRQLTAAHGTSTHSLWEIQLAERTGRTMIPDPMPHSSSWHNDNSLRVTALPAHSPKGGAYFEQKISP